MKIIMLIVSILVLIAAGTFAYFLYSCDKDPGGHIGYWKIGNVTCWIGSK